MGGRNENVPAASLKRLKRSSIAVRLTWFREPSWERDRRFELRLIDGRVSVRVRENGNFDVRDFLTRPLDAPLMPVLGGSKGSLGGQDGTW